MLFLLRVGTAFFKKLALINVTPKNTCFFQLEIRESLLLEKMAEIQVVVAFEHYAHVSFF